MKTKLFLVFILLVPALCVIAQENKASVLLSSAIYEEEVAGNLNKAADIYLDLIKKYPDDRPVAARALYHLGLITEKMGKEKAGDYFSRLVNNYPDQKELVVLAKERLAKFDSVTSVTTIKAELSFKQASELYGQSKYEASSAEYEKVMRLVPKSGMAQEAQLWVGQCQFKLGKYDQALASFKSIKEDYPQGTIIPVTEMLISQTVQKIRNNPSRKPVVKVDDKTILDTETGIKYTRINSIAGKNDIIKEVSSISGVSPNRRFVLVDNKVIPFDNGDSFEVFDSPPGSWSYSRLSPDGSKIAYIQEQSISVIPVFPESGRPAGPGNILVKGQYRRGDKLNWSADGEKLVLSLQGVGARNLWILSAHDGSLKQITSAASLDMDPVFSRNGRNLIYRNSRGGQYSTVRIRPVEGQKSLVIVDSCISYNPGDFKLSPDNEWLIYSKTFLDKFLFRLADKQKQELTSPPEVGDLVSWTPEGNTLFYYRSSFDVQGANKVLSVFGGPSVEFGKQIYSPSWLHFWAPDSKSFMTVGENLDRSKRVFWIVPLDGEAPRELDADQIENPESLSPDGSKLVYYSQSEGLITNILVAPVSLKNTSITGPSVLIYKNALNPGRMPGWSPDGSKIVLSIAGDIWICHTNGERQVQITNTPENESSPVWSPDGNLIKCEFYVGRSGMLKVIRTADGEVIRTIENRVRDAWSPDGKELAVAFQNGDLSVVTVETGETRNIANWKADSIASIAYLEWSPDGKTIAFIGDDNVNDYENHIYILQAKGGKINQLDSDDDGGKALLRWSPDSKWLSYYSDDGSKKNRVEGTLWEADLTDFMKKMKPGKEIGYTTDLDINSLASKSIEVKPDGTFTDARDGHVYKFKNISEQIWMAENLAWLPEVSPVSVNSQTDKCYYVLGYDGSDVSAAKSTENYRNLGVLYNWPAALDGTSGVKSSDRGVKGVCPAGWHLPDDSDWMELEKYLGMSETQLKQIGARSSGSVGAKLKAAQGWDEDDLYTGQSGFNAGMGGAYAKNGKFAGMNNWSGFWVYTNQTGQYAGRSINAGSNAITRDIRPISPTALSVRCIKDK